VLVFFYVKLGMVHAGFLAIAPRFYAISMADTRPCARCPKGPTRGAFPTVGFAAGLPKQGAPRSAITAARQRQARLAIVESLSVLG